MAISSKKRRYTLTLTPGRVERFQRLCKEIGLPPATMSNACDDIIDSLADQFEVVKEKGNISVSQLLKLMGGQMELLEDQGKEVNRVLEQKRDTVPNKHGNA